MLNKDKEIKNPIILPPESIINHKIYFFLYSLISKIFLKDNKVNSNFLQNFINKVNKEIIKVESKYINTEYNSDNLKNIFLFIQNQNIFFADDILEGILIIIFSSVYIDNINYTLDNIFMSKKGDCKLFSSGNYEISDLFDSNKLFPKELHNLKELLELEDKYEKLDNKNKLLKESIFYTFLNEIKYFKEKFYVEKNKNNKIIDKRKDNNKLLTLNKNYNKKLIRLFLISVFIYCQNKNSPFMQYIKEKTIKNKESEKYLSSIPFNYDLSYAYITNIFSNLIFSPIKIEPRINEISLSHNKLESNGLFNLAKSLILNKNIKNCYLNESYIKSYDLHYFNIGFAIFDNFTLKELNISCNEINKDTELYLSKLLSHLKGLKIINLSGNNLKRGLVSFFIMLKELYNHKEINLETLILDKCELDNSSFYELGELLKSPFCKLKKLYLNKNIIQDCDKFLKKLKQNKSLEELYLNSTNINDNDIDNIIRVIRNTHIQVLYLYKNLISDLDDLIRIIYTSKVVKFNSTNNEKNEFKSKVFNEQSFLENLDLSNNLIIHKNKEGVKLLLEIKDKTNLSCLDLSGILHEIDFNMAENQNEYKDYKEAVEMLSNEIIKDKEDFINNKLEEKKIINDKNSEIEIIKDLEEKFFNYYNKDIINILKNCSNVFKIESTNNIIDIKRKIKGIIFDLSEKNFEIKEILIIKDKNNNKNFKLNIDAYKNIENYLLHNVLLKKAKKAEAQLKNSEKYKKDRKLFII